MARTLRLKRRSNDSSVSSVKRAKLEGARVIDEHVQASGELAVERGVELRDECSRAVVAAEVRADGFRLAAGVSDVADDGFRVRLLES